MPQWPAVGSGEHERVGAARPGGEVLLDLGRERCRDRHRSVGVGLGRAVDELAVDLLDRLGDLQSAVERVDPTDPQGRHLAGS
jgi:hypothetical protein